MWLELLGLKRGQQMQTNALTPADAPPNTKLKDCASEAFSPGACLSEPTEAGIMLLVSGVMASEAVTALGYGFGARLMGVAR